MSPIATEPDEDDDEDLMARVSREEFDEKREDLRTTLVRTGELEVNGEKFACYILDLSKHGTRIRTLEPLQSEPSLVKLHMPDIGVFDADVRWIREKEIGLLLHEEIEAPEDHESTTIDEVLRIQNTE